MYYETADVVNISLWETVMKYGEVYVLI